MAQSLNIDFDLRQFKKSSRRLSNKTYPEAVAKAMQILTRRVQATTRRETRQNFDLSTQWVPKNIKNFPETPGQMSKIRRDVQFKHKFVASVAATDKIAFMTGHDQGARRRPTHGVKAIALPGRGLRKKAFRTSVGKTRKRWQPKTLLEEYNKNSRRQQRNRQKLPFIIRSRSGGEMIVRRLGKQRRPLEVLYNLKNEADIKPTWNFTSKGEAQAKQRYMQVFRQVWSKID